MTIYSPDYPANYQPLANNAADSSFRGNPMAAFYEGGRVGTKPVSIRVPREPVNYAKGGLAAEARRVQDAGVGGDELIIHINRDEFEQLKEQWGEPTINPHTGMPQFTPFWKQKWFAPVAAIASTIAAPYLAPVVGGALGIAEGATILGANAANVATGALLGAGTGALTGGGKGALTGALLGGAAPIATTALSSALEGTALGGLFGAGAGSTAGMDANPPIPQPRPGGSEVNAAITEAGKAASGATGIMDTLSKPSVLIPAALLGAAALGGGGPKALPTQGATSTPTDTNLTRPLATTPLTRTRLAQPMDYYNYGTMPEQRYYAPQNQPVQAAIGGPLSRFVQGGGTGRSDSIDAKLSDGEYVIDAETVALLGDGSSKAGAKRLDQFRANIRKQKGRELARGKFSADAKRPEEYI